MTATYKVLDVHQRLDEVIAVLPIAHVVGEAFRLRLDADFDQLVTERCNAVILDLRQVEKIDGSFIARLLRIRKALEDSSVRLSVCIAGDLKEIVRVLDLGQLIEIVDNIGEDVS